MAKDAIYLDSQDLSKLYKATRKVDQEVTKNLRKRILAVTKPIVQEVKVAALSLPSKSGESLKPVRGQLKAGFRQGLASAIETRINPSNSGSFSVRIRVSGTKFKEKTGKYRTLPRYMEGLSRRKTWRHPVYADKGSSSGTWKGEWAEQESHPFLLTTVCKHKEEVRKEVI
jgi:hypothetical protein